MAVFGMSRLRQSNVRARGSSNSVLSLRRRAAVRVTTVGLYKMGDGSNSTSNCFPARNILRTSREGDTASSAAGHVPPAGAAPPSTLGLGVSSCGFLYQCHS